ncbi:MAG: hypothetical protein P8188_02555 [Gemmatimonadota bacterium]
MVKTPAARGFRQLASVSVSMDEDDGGPGMSRPHPAYEGEAGGAVEGDVEEEHIRDSMPQRGPERLRRGVAIHVEPLPHQETFPHLPLREVVIQQGDERPAHDPFVS